MSPRPTQYSQSVCPATRRVTVRRSSLPLGQTQCKYRATMSSMDHRNLRVPRGFIHYILVLFYCYQEFYLFYRGRPLTNEAATKAPRGHHHCGQTGSCQSSPDLPALIPSSPSLPALAIVIGKAAGQTGRSSVIPGPAGACHRSRQLPLPDWSRTYSTTYVTSLDGHRSGMGNQN